MLVAVGFWIATSGNVQGLVGDFTETFSGGGGNNAATGIFSLGGYAADTSFTLEDTAADASFLDGADDGYALLHRTSTAKKTVGFYTDLGVVAAADVGQTVIVEVAFRQLQSSSTDFFLLLDGAPLDGDAEMRVGGYTSQNGTIGYGSGTKPDWLLSTVPLRNYQVGDTNGTPTGVYNANNGNRSGTGPLFYTIQSSDVGKTISVRISFYDSSNVGGEGLRDLAIDSIEYSLQSSWDQFLKAKASNGAIEPILPDYSYAGYAMGETNIPPAQGTIFNVMDFGAEPNDGESDRAAIELAIATAETNGGGIIFFPPGVFRVSEVPGAANGIAVRGANIVLHGSGSGPGGTEIFMNENIDGKVMFGFSSPTYPIQNKTDITADASRETFSITVANASGLQPEMLVELYMNSNTNANEEFLDGLEPWDLWSTTVTNGVFVRGERHRIKSVVGNEVTFYEPIHCNIIAAHNWKVRATAFVQGWGVEDIHFRGNWTDVFDHHLNSTHDSGWQWISFFYGESPYVRRCRFSDCSKAVGIAGCYNGTILNCSIEGNQGHASFASEYYSGGTLMSYCADMVTNGAFHGFAANAGAVGTVITRCKNSNRGFDWHASWPYCTLIDACSGGLIGNGGNYLVLPNHMRHLTFWNFNQTAGEVFSDYNWWEPRVGTENYSGAKVVNPLIVGYHGLGTTFKADSCLLIESPGAAVGPASLYEAQLEASLGYLPDWISAASNEYSFFMGNGYWNSEKINLAPEFDSETISKSNATEDSAYSATLAGDATDPNGDVLVYNKVGEDPAWLTVASDGTLSGTPGTGDLGQNTFTVQVSDGEVVDTATLLITVDPVNWTVLTSDDFDSGWGNWSDGGSDARRTSTLANGANCVELRDNTSSSVITLTSSLDLTGYSELRVDFSYAVLSFENSEDFWLRYSSDGGSSWTIVQAFVNVVDFVDDGTRYNPSITINSGAYTFNNNVKIQFRCDASGNGDDVYIDDVILSAQ